MRQAIMVQGSHVPREESTVTNNVSCTYIGFTKLRICLETYLMKNRTFAHIGHCNTGHDDERSNHITLRPCFQNKAIWIGRPFHETLLKGESLEGWRKWTHDG